MSFRKEIALILGKNVFYLTRTLKIGGGSAAPGLYTLKLYPGLVKDLASKIPNRVIITGTNGKTTTARFLSHFARTSNLKVLTNSTGSNLERGIASALIEQSGNLKNIDLSIWEIDEAAFNLVAPKINPNKIVFLNIFRDQLDRYGEVDTIIKKWLSTLSTLPKNLAVFINSDDHNLLALSKLKRQTISFGVEDYKIRGEKVNKKDVRSSTSINQVRTRGLKGTLFNVKIQNKIFKNIFLPLPGIYHLYDFLAAFSVGLSLELDPQKMIDSLKTFSPAFGRVEKFTMQPGRLQAEIDGYIFLIKNPAGANQVLFTIKDELKPHDRLLIALNDNLADGKDVSWIWDTDFEKLPTTNYKLQTICSGTRAYDLANRLKYAGMDPKNIIIEPNLSKALEKAKAGLKGKLFMLPTYTALLEIQKILAKQGIKKHYWREL